jgi:CO/xanthine dehydrogenase FAD-binding subunit
MTPMPRVLLPSTLDDLWEVLEKEPDAIMYAGGTDLLVKIRSGEVNPSSLICLERIPELRGVQDHNGEVFIAAASTHGCLLEDPVIKRQFPVLIQGLRVLGSPAVRHAGTIGGNIVTASPAGDSLPALYALGAEVEIRRFDGSRRSRIRDFILGPGTVDLRSGEVLTGIWLKKDPGWHIHHYEKVGRRKGQACAVASMAALIKATDAGLIEKARFAWGSVGPTVVTSEEVDRALIGKPLGPDTLKAAADLVHEVVSPIDDVRASADYRRLVAGLLLMRLSDYPQ